MLTAHLSGRRREDAKRWSGTFETEAAWFEPNTEPIRHLSSAQMMGAEGKVGCCKVRVCTSMQLMASCQRPGGFSCASNMLRRGSIGSAKAELETGGAELGRGRLAPGRAQDRAEDTGS